MKKIGVIGLGYVGLPVALQAAKKGFDVVGVDLDGQKIKTLSEGASPISDVANEEISHPNITYSINPSDIAEVEIAIVCVPTPVDEDKMPDLSIVKSATIQAAANLSPDTLLIVESTINPGVCEEILIPEIENATEHKIGKTLEIAHCPERINPGDPKWGVHNINRVLGANSSEALERAYEFYSTLLDSDIKRMQGLKEAEAVKVVENSFRDINIAFVNELAMSFEKLGIDIKNVIDGAATKPFGYMPFYPGIGVGGHCIPVDPYYLIEYAKHQGFDHQFLKLARSINDNMPLHVVNTVEGQLIAKGLGSLEAKNVAVLGLSYKPNVGDERESPSLKLISLLQDRKAAIAVFDPYIDHPLSTSSAEDALKNCEVAILATAHDSFSTLSPWESGSMKVFFDGRNYFSKERSSFSKSGITYLSI